jgi:hypothetical protein
MAVSYDGDYYTGQCKGHEDYNKKDQQDSGSLIHGMQPSDHNDLHDISANSIIETTVSG